MWKKKEKADIAEIITNQIIEQLEKGVIPWQKTWINSCKNAVSKKEYRGINRLNLSMIMIVKEFKSPYWVTYNQAKELGGNIRKGEHGTPIIFWKIINYPELKEDMEISEKNIPYMRYSTVFNLDQTDGIDLSKFQISPMPNDPIEQAEKIIKNWKEKPQIKYCGTQPCYLHKEDVVECPDKSNFTSSEEFYSALFHELTHSTGHESRLNREGISKLTFFGNENYAIEELIAELGSSFLCSYAGIEKTIQNSASYLQNWLKALKNDKKMIITASARAEKAYQMIIKKRDEKYPDEFFRDNCSFWNCRVMARFRLMQKRILSRILPYFLPHQLLRNYYR